MKHMADNLENKVKDENAEQKAAKTVASSQKSKEEQFLEQEIKEAIAIAVELEETGKKFSEDEDLEKEFSGIYDKFKQGNNPNPLYLNGAVADYDEMFSHLGRLESRTPYQPGLKAEQIIESMQKIEHMIVTEADTKQLSMNEKYLLSGPNMNGITGLMPGHGFSSEKWEKMKIYAILEPHMTKLHWSIN